MPGALLTAARHPFQLGAAGYRLVLGEKASEGFGTMYFCVQTETLPRADSRVMLDRRTDAIGMPSRRRGLAHGRCGAAHLGMFVGRLDALLRNRGLGQLGTSDFPLEPDLDRLSQRISRRLPPHRNHEDGD